VRLAASRGLDVQYELGGKHDGPFTDPVLDDLLATGRAWLDAGAVDLIIEAREDACGVGLFDAAGRPNWRYADRIVETFGAERVTFEAPTKRSQFGFLDRLEEVLRVEIYRYGLHSDAFANPRLRPQAPPARQCEP
jgi:phosphosulfolactate synthase